MCVCVCVCVCPSPSLKSQALVMQLLSEDHHIDFSSEKHQHEIIFDRERLVLSGVVGAWYILRNGRIREPLIAFSFFEFLNCILFIFLYSRFLFVIHFIHISVYTCRSQSPNSSPPHPHHFLPLVSIRFFSTSVSRFLPCKLVHLYHFSRFHIYAVIYDICFSLLDLPHSV